MGFGKGVEMLAAIMFVCGFVSGVSITAACSSEVLRYEFHAWRLRKQARREREEQRRHFAKNWQAADPDHVLS